MRLVSNALACCALCIVFGASQPVFAQTSSPPHKQVVADPAAEALNKLLDAAQAAADKQDYAEAARNYEDYLAKMPDDAIVHYDLGYAYSALNRQEDAKGEFQRAIALDPKMSAGYLNLGVLLLGSDPAAAVEPLENAADLAPQDARTKRILGTALERSGKLAPAIEQYQAARNLDETDFRNRVALGHALLSAGRASEAETEYRAALTLNATEIEIAQAHLGLAEILIAAKKLPEGAGELELYLKVQPNDAKTRVERAAVLIDLEKYDDALAELDRAAKAGAEDLRGLKLRSDIYWRQKRYADAVPVLQRAAALAPKDADIIARLGEVYLQAKDYVNAVHWLATAYSMDPKAGDVLDYLIAAEIGGKNYSGALRALDELETRQELSAQSWYLRASCYDNLGQAAQALDAYKRFLQLNKDENSDMYFVATDRVRALGRELQNKKR
jgi:tetratricopeptide (TPR) repeat protein